MVILIIILLPFNKRIDGGKIAEKKKNIIKKLFLGLIKKAPETDWKIRLKSQQSTDCFIIVSTFNHSL